MEVELWEAVQKNDIETVKGFRNRTDVLVRDLPFMQALISEAIGLANCEMLTTVVDLFACNNQHAYQVITLRNVETFQISKDCKLLGRNCSLQAAF